jgi:hypothetical protein
MHLSRKLLALTLVTFFDTTVTKLLAIQPIPPLESALADLRSDDWSAREAAQAKLVELAFESDPTSVVNAMKERLAQTADPEEITRLEAALASIDEQRLLRPTRITLDLQQVTPADLVNALNAQSQGDLVLPEYPGTPLERLFDFRVVNATYWETLAELERITNLGVVINGNIWTLQVGGNRQFAGIKHERGPFLFSVNSIHYTRIRQIGLGTSNENFIVQATLRGEPKVHMANGQTRVTLERAVDDLGQSLLREGSATSSFVQNAGFANLQFQLRYPKNPGQEIVELAGRVHVNIASRVQQIAIPDLSNFDPIEVDIENGTLRIEVAPENLNIPELQRGENTHIVRFTVRGSVQATARQRVLEAIQSARVLDAKSRPVHQRNMNTRAGNANTLEIHVAYRPPQQADATPLSFNLDIPSDFREIEVPFNITNIPMP